MALSGVATMMGAIALEAIAVRINPVSLSGALFGGLLFGAGMVLARGCASRHLVLAASGNVRSVVTFAIFAVAALAAISGPLAPLRQAISSLWMIGLI